MAKAGCRRTTDAEARRRGERTGLDTLVVRAVNDVHWARAQERACRSERGKCTAWGVCPQG